MPQRTNPFQNLVELIHRATAPYGAIVRSSALVKSSDSSHPREIDVLIEETGQRLLKVAVEARDTGRKVDVTAMEQFIGKYRSRSGFDFQKVIIVSRSGFTVEAERRAKLENLETVSLREAMDKDWETWCPRHLRMSIHPQLVGVELKPPVDGIPQDVLLSEGILYCERCDRTHGSPQDMAERVVRREDVRTHIRIAASQTGQTTFACIECTRGLKYRLRFRDVDYPIESLVAHVMCIEAEGLLNVTKWSMDGASIHHLQGEIGGSQVELVLPDGPDSHSVSIRLKAGNEAYGSKPSKPVSVHAPRIAMDDPDEFAGIVQQIREELESLQCNICESAQIYSFTSKSFETLHLAVGINLGRYALLKTGVYFLQNLTTLDDAKLAELSELLAGCEMHRIVLVVANSVDSAIRETATQHGLIMVSLKEPPVAWINLFFPPLLLFSEGIVEFSGGHLFVDVVPEGLRKNPSLSIRLPNGLRRPFGWLSEVLYRELFKRAAEMALSDSRWPRVSLEYRIPFISRVGPDVAIVTPGGGESHLFRIEGTALVRISPFPIEHARILAQSDMSQLDLISHITAEHSLVCSGELPAFDSLSIRVEPDTFNWSWELRELDPQPMPLPELLNFSSCTTLTEPWNSKKLNLKIHTPLWQLSMRPIGGRSAARCHNLLATFNAGTIDEF